MSCPASPRCSSSTARTRTPPAARSSSTRSAGRLHPPGARPAAADAARPRSTSGLRSRPRATGACRHVRRDRLDPVRLLVPRRRAAGSWTNWPGYMTDYASRLGELDPDEFVLAPTTQPADDPRRTGVLHSKGMIDELVAQIEGRFDALAGGALGPRGDREPRAVHGGQPRLPRARAGRQAGDRVPPRRRRRRGCARAAGRGRQRPRAARADGELARADRARSRRRSAWPWSSATPTTPT